MKLNESIKILYENGFKLQPKLQEKLAGSNSEPFELEKIQKYMEKMGYEWEYNEGTFYFNHPRKFRIIGNLIPGTAYIINGIDGNFYFGRSLKDWKKDLRKLGVI